LTFFGKVRSETPLSLYQQTTPMADMKELQAEGSLSCPACNLVDFLSLESGRQQAAPPPSAIGYEFEA
jgi:hypothetical protein